MSDTRPSVIRERLCVLVDDVVNQASIGKRFSIASAQAAASNLIQKAHAIAHEGEYRKAKPVSLDDIKAVTWLEPEQEAVKPA